MVSESQGVVFPHSKRSVSSRKRDLPSPTPFHLCFILKLCLFKVYNYAMHVRIHMNMYTRLWGVCVCLYMKHSTNREVEEIFRSQSSPILPLCGPNSSCQAGPLPEEGTGEPSPHPLVFTSKSRLCI